MLHKFYRLLPAGEMYLHRKDARRLRYFEDGRMRRAFGCFLGANCEGIIKL